MCVHFFSSLENWMDVQNLTSPGFLHLQHPSLNQQFRSQEVSTGIMAHFIALFLSGQLNDCESFKSGFCEV